MNKKERVLAAINGDKVDRLPASFSIHFADDEKYGEKAVEAHLRFFEETDIDIIKIMNENLVSSIYDIERVDDWKQVKKLSIKDEFITRQLDLVKTILDNFHGEAFSVGTLHGSVASVLHIIEARYGYQKGREIITNHMREDKILIMDAFKHITELLSELGQKYIQLGLDGVYYASLGESKYFTDEEFSKNIMDFDKQILKAIKEHGGYNILHICKDDIDLNRYKSFDELIDVINWGVYEGGVSLEEGRKTFPETTIMGGLRNRSGVLIDGDYEELKAEIKSIINDIGKEKFILGADCTLPSDISYERLRLVIEALEEVR